MSLTRKVAKGATCSMMAYTLTLLMQIQMPTRNNHLPSNFNHRLAKTLGFSGTFGNNYRTLHLANSHTKPETTLYSYVNDLDPVQQNPRTDPYNTKLIYPTRNDTLTKIKVFQQSQCFLLGFPNMN